jgi:small subunit ribosomal protein S8
MPITDPIANLICMIKNGVTRKKKEIILDSSNVRKEILRILKDEKYIENFEILDPDINKKRKFEQIKITFRYLENGESFIRDLKRVSKPGRRIYVNSKNIPVVLNHIGIAIISTNKGILTDGHARQEHVGGEYLCKIW